MPVVCVPVACWEPPDTPDLYLCIPSKSTLVLDSVLHYPCIAHNLPADDGQCVAWAHYGDERVLLGDARRFFLFLNREFM